MQQNTACNSQEQSDIIQYGSDFVNQFQAVVAMKGNGAFITSCICHGCPWSNLTLSDKVVGGLGRVGPARDPLTGSQLQMSYQAFSDWYNGVGTPTNIYVDSRPPNGGGAIAQSECRHFP
jgi:hypothetical protein